MGLDIHICVDNAKEVFNTEYWKTRKGNFNKHSLSRTFCNLMCRKNVVDHKAEFDQISEITNIDISAIYEMEIREDPSFENIDNVIKTLNELINTLKTIDDLPEKLLETDFDTLFNEEYFDNFKKDTGEGYIGNNFGQDLRNFLRFLNFAKRKGTRKVWFSYG